MKIVINGKPIPLKRPRVTIRGGFVHAYDPSSKDKDIALLSIVNRKDIVLLEDCPIKFDITAYMPIPKSLSDKKKKELIGTYHIKKPDVDNICKFYLDLLEGVCYTKDSNICILTSKKVYSEDPRVEINIEKI